MTFINPDNNLLFLAGGGKMGNEIRNKDWGETSLHAPSAWQQSLRTTLNILLNAPVPMILFWGPEQICFYNDAYQESLPDKQTIFLGLKASEATRDAWPQLKTLIESIRNTGKPTLHSDPLHFTGGESSAHAHRKFMYCPVMDELGGIGGILLTGNETGHEIATRKKLQDRDRQFQLIFEQAPVAVAIFRGPDYITEMANARVLDIVGRGDEIFNKPILECLPELESQGIRVLLDDVFNTGKSFSATELPLSIMRNGRLETVFLNFSFNPLHNSAGEIDGIMAVGMETTAQVMVNRKIKESEKKLNVVIEASELATWELDLITRAASYSDRYLEILGYPPGTVLTHPQILKHLHPEDLHIRERAFEDAFSSGVLHYESRLVWNDGSLHWMEGRGKVFFDDAGTPVNMIGTVRDITEEKYYQKQLEEREQKFRLLADSIPQHIWTTDQEGNINYYNRSFYEYSGLSHNQISKGSWIQMVHPGEQTAAQLQWEECLANGKSFLLEQRLRKRTNEYRWHLTRIVPQKDEKGKIGTWVGTSMDIQDQKTFTTELKRQVDDRTSELVKLNESLKQSEERYHLMVEEVQDYAILYLNRDGTVENWNAGAEKIKGYHAQEIIGRNFSVFYTNEDRQNNLPQRLLQHSLLTGRAVQEGWRVKKDGTLFWASVVITAVHNEQNEVIGFSKVTHDLTQKKEANDKLIKNAAELQEKNEDLRKMNKELEAFAYISSHDLQEPLRKIQTFATRIAEKESENLSTYGKDYFERMQNAAARMQTLIDDLLAYSRTTTGERKYEPTALSHIVDGVKADFSEELQQKQATVEVGEMCTISIIPFQFRQLLYNLIGNSLKFSVPDRLPVIRIESKIALGKHLNEALLASDTEYCHIRVADNGIGFEQQYGEKIFELFQRLHGRSNYIGTGIGLAIVKKIVDNHNGLIKAHGAVNEGAVFDIYLPVIHS